MPDVATPVATPAPAPREAHRSPHTAAFLVSLYVIAVVSGAKHAFPARQARSDLLVEIALAAVLSCWAIRDARCRGRPIPITARQWFFLGSSLLVPGYVIWTRRWRGVGWVVLHTVAWYLVAAVSMVSVGLSVFGIGWFRRLSM